MERGLGSLGSDSARKKSKKMDFILSPSLLSADFGHLADDVEMVAQQAEARYVTLLTADGNPQYDLSYKVVALVTNKSNQPITYSGGTDGPLRCKIRLYGAGPMGYLRCPAVTIAAQDTATVTFTGQHTLGGPGKPIPSVPWQGPDAEGNRYTLPFSLFYFGNGGEEELKDAGVALCYVGLE